MIAYTLRKLLQAVLLMAVVLVINFTILRLTPGKPYDAQKYLLSTLLCWLVSDFWRVAVSVSNKTQACLS